MLGAAHRVADFPGVSLACSNGQGHQAETAEYENCKSSTDFLPNRFHRILLGDMDFYSNGFPAQESVTAYFLGTKCSATFTVLLWRSTFCLGTTEYDRLNPMSWYITWKNRCK